MKGATQGPRRTPRRPFHVAQGIARGRYRSGAARAAIASSGLAKQECTKGVEASAYIAQYFYT